MVRVSLAIRFIVFTSLLVLVTSLTLSLFMLAREELSEDEQIRHRSVSLARNFAYNAELGVLTHNSNLLLELAMGLLRETDVVSVSVTDSDGVVLLERISDPDLVSSLIHVPAVETRAVGLGEASIAPYTKDGSDRTEAYEVTFPVFTRREERRNEEIGFLLEEGKGSEGKLESIGHVSVMVSLAGMHQDISALKWAFGLLTFVVIAVAILLTIMLVRKMVAPLQALAAATRRIAGGSLDEVVVGTSNDEIGELARRFNMMTSELKRSRNELERYSAGLEDQVRLRTRELEEAQSQLVQAEKMSAVGLLVSGVAHELNNPLAGVVGYSQLLLRNDDVDERILRGLEKINREAERCKKIVQNLQTFARKHKPQKDHVGINGILEGALELRAYQLKVDNIEVVTDLQQDLPKTMGDFHQLQQVFLNIIINAHQAMASRGEGGSLILCSRRREDQIVVQIEDTGPGIPPGDLGKVFDPFFTTKEVGQGTGLGLSICYGIIEEHKGRISARNSPAGGAIFTVELPILEQEATVAERQTAHREEIDLTTPRRNILVVDDEMSIIDILYQVLKADGHRVDTALNGSVALRKIRSERYDLIICDLKMPGMSGQELYEKVRVLNRELSERIVFSTGDVVSSETYSFLEGSGNTYLQKPFELDAIRKVVHTVLESRRQ